MNKIPKMRHYCPEVGEYLEEVSNWDILWDVEGMSQSKCDVCGEKVTPPLRAVVAYIYQQLTEGEDNG